MQEKELNNLDLSFTEQDYKQIAEQGITIGKIQKQLHYYNKGVLKTIVVEPATIGNGIIQLDESQIQQKANFFDDNKSNLKLIKIITE